MGSKSRLLFKPVDPFQGGELDRVERAPWSAPMNDLGFVEAVDGLGQGVVIAVADAADGRLDPGLGQALGVLDRDMLTAAVAVSRAAKLDLSATIPSSLAASRAPAQSSLSLWIETEAAPPSA
jgi:hypothetical protein